MAPDTAAAAWTECRHNGARYYEPSDDTVRCLSCGANVGPKVVEDGT